MRAERARAEKRMRREYRAYEEARREFYRSCHMSERDCEALLKEDERAFRSFASDVRRRANVDPDRLAATEPARDYVGDEWRDELEDERTIVVLAVLSGDEIDILGDCVARGFTQREIAKARHISQSTVSKRLGEIFSKLRLAAKEFEEHKEEK